jgi:hypothetical protein
MNTLYLLGGFICLGLGIFMTRKQIIIFKQAKQDQLGWDIKGLGAGICFIIIGISSIIKYL